MSESALLDRIRGEFREMPGLRLTFAQACRLWQVDAPACQIVLDALLLEGFLHRTQDGAYLALPQPRQQVRTALAARLADRARSA
jgi:hypothetical protein